MFDLITRLPRLRAITSEWLKHQPGNAPITPPRRVAPDKPRAFVAGDLHDIYAFGAPVLSVYSPSYARSRDFSKNPLCMIAVNIPVYIYIRLCVLCWCPRYNKHVLHWET